MWSGSIRAIVDEAAARLAGLRVLVVEDSQTNQYILARLFDAAGIETLCVSSGPEALDVLARERFDLLLVDIHMPGMDGYETAGRIRRVLDQGAPPMVAMSANACVREHGAEYGAAFCGVLAKPIDPAELFGLLSRCVEKGLSRKA